MISNYDGRDSCFGIRGEDTVQSGPGTNVQCVRTKTVCTSQPLVAATYQIKWFRNQELQKTILHVTNLKTKFVASKYV